LITAVLDANALVSALLVAQGVPAAILRAAYERRFVCISSAPIVTEVFRTLTRPRVQRRFQIQPADVERLRRFLESDLVLVAITAQVHGAATHPEDDLVLAPAVSARSDYLVTGDRQLQNLGTYQGVSILSPRQFLEVLQREE
jgi:putative PIN family toxin of toxin-antitoxin system